MSVLNHHILDIVRKVVGLKGYQIVLLHNVFYGDTLVDESCHCKSIQGRADDHAVIFHGCILDIIRHLSTVADNDAAHVLADGTQMVLVSVTQDHQVVLLQKFSQLIRMGRADNHFSPDKISMGISRYHGTIHSVGNASVLGSGI